MTIGRSLSAASQSLFTSYNSILAANLGLPLSIAPLTPFCAQQLVFMTSPLYLDCRVSSHGIA